VNDFLVFFLGLLTGGTVAWLWATSRARADAATGSAALRDRATAAETSARELRQQLDAREADLTAVREQLATTRQSLVAAETRHQAAVQHFEEQKRLLDEARAKLADTFKALSADALKANSETFAKQAEERIKPLKEVLEKYETQVKELEKARVGAYEGIRQQMKSIGEAHRQLQQQTGKLVTALRAPQVRGRWGELTLRNVVELAGMSAHCDFREQQSVDTDEGLLRPDLLVNLPGNRTLVVDSKTPLEDYLSAVEAGDEETRTEHLRRHAAATRKHLQQLSGKAYWSRLPATPEFVVMFIPGESFFAAALEQERTLIEEGIEARVILATPTTLVALLRTVAYSWQQQQMVENAEQIARQARLLFERVQTFAEHFGKIGRELTGAVHAYNAAIRSWQSRVLPAGRNLPALGAVTGGEEFPDPGTIDVLPAGAASVPPGAS
jgi:DNA recombination protein RmuC